MELSLRYTDPVDRLSLFRRVQRIAQEGDNLDRFEELIKSPRKRQEPENDGDED